MSRKVFVVITKIELFAIECRKNQIQSNHNGLSEEKENTLKSQ